MSLPANSTFDAIAFSPASMHKLDANSTIYAIPVTFNKIAKNSLFIPTTTN